MCFHIFGVRFKKHTVPPESFTRGARPYLQATPTLFTCGCTGAVSKHTTVEGLSPDSFSLHTSFVRTCSSHGQLAAIRANFTKAYALFLRLYADLGLMTSRQSKSPRSSAMISASAVAILVATGMLYISHIRNSS